MPQLLATDARTAFQDLQSRIRGVHGSEQGPRFERIRRVL